MFSEGSFAEEDDEYEMRYRDDVRTAKILFLKTLVRISPPAFREEIGKINSTVDCELNWEARNLNNQAAFADQDSDASDFHHFSLSASVFKVERHVTQQPFGSRDELIRRFYALKMPFVNQTLKLIDNDWADERRDLLITDDEPSPGQILLLDAQKRAEDACKNKLELRGDYNAIEAVIEQLHRQCHQAMGIRRKE